VRRKLLDILCCPVCKGELTLKVIEENESEIVEGSLWCNACEVEYPIIEGIPNLLPSDEAEDSS
jgi:uncharacterized protein YbaR (Trm112 family)